MKISFLNKNLITIALLFSVFGCTSSRIVPADEMLQEMEVNQDTYSKMSVCQQIKIYAEMGEYYLDIDHMAVLLPKWLEDIIDNEPKNEVANCIAEEGMYRLNLLAGQPNSKKDLSLSFHALIYKASDLKLLDYPEIQLLMSTAICHHNLDYEFELVLIDYVNHFGAPPQYLKQNDATEKMKSELCN